MPARHPINERIFLCQDTLLECFPKDIRDFPTVRGNLDEHCKCFDGNPRNPKVIVATELSMSVKPSRSMKQQPACQISFAAPPAGVSSASTPGPQKLKGTNEKLIIMMVGLPARVKSYITKKSADI